mmetsp:Transcript_20911/g.72139  ORF Transcript_20911/g.72139 Transcript_20911/m.72139 type:complete len:239 (-) Transcript_20911:174-890(-)
MPGSTAALKMTSLSTCRSAPSFSMGSRTPQKISEAAPGPGKYGIPSNVEVTKRSATVRFGGGTQLRNKDWKSDGPGSIPGPGQYTSFDPNQSSAAFQFGSEARLPQRKPRAGPDPGQYEMKSTLTNKTISMSGRFEGKKPSHTNPSPGQYGIPRQDGIRPAAAVVASLRFTEDRTKTGFLMSTVVSPDPGRYESLKELGGNIATKTTPSFTFSSRRKPLRPDNGGHVGPNVPHYTTFG